MGGVEAWCPQATGDGFGKAVGYFAQSGGVVFGDEVAGGFVAQIGVIGQIEMMAFGSTRAGGEGEQIIHRGRDFEGTLIAVAFHTCDPFGVDRARAHDAGDFFLQRADDGPFRAGMVVVVDFGKLAGSVFGSRCHSAFKLVVIIRIEQIMLAVILVVQNRLDAG